MSQFFIPYLSFENSMEVAKYYTKIFDGEIIYVMRGSDMPECPPDNLDDIMHLEIKIKDNLIYMADATVEYRQEKIYLLLNYADLDEQMNHYNRMAKDGKITEEMHDTFWGARFGVIKDKFGVSWEFHCPLQKK